MIRLGYRKTHFIIDETKVIYEHDFLWRKHKEIMLVNVKEIEVKSSFFQKIAQLGSVVLHTHASLSRTSAPGLCLYDLKDDQEIFRFLKDKISRPSSS